MIPRNVKIIFLHFCFFIIFCAVIFFVFLKYCEEMVDLKSKIYYPELFTVQQNQPLKPAQLLYFN